MKYEDGLKKLVWRENKKDWYNPQTKVKWVYVPSCLNCGDHFFADIRKVRKGLGKYCTNKCHITSKEKIDSMTGKLNSSYNSVELICENCGIVYPKMVCTSEKSKYCSRKCKDEARKTGKYLNCMNCGKEEYVAKGRLKTWKFCSPGCQDEFYTGKNNPRYTRKEIECCWCGKKFYRMPSAIKDDNYCCPECRVEGTRKYSKQEWSEKEKWIKQMRSDTRQIYNKYKHLINPDNLTISLGGNNVDHMFTLSDAFDLRKFGIVIESKVINHPVNLQVLTREENCKKSKKSSITLEDLYRKIEKFPEPIIIRRKLGVKKPKKSFIKKRRLEKIKI